MATKIIFLILPNTHLMDLAGPDQVFLEAIDFGADLEIEYCSYANNISTSAGLPFGKVRHFSKVNYKKGDFLFIPGADIAFLHSAEFTKQKLLFSWIKKCYEDKVIICSVCTGSFVLALSGILDGKNCTTHWKRTTELQKMYPKFLHDNLKLHIRYPVLPLQLLYRLQQPLYNLVNQFHLYMKLQK